MKKIPSKIAIVNTTHIGTMLMTMPLVNRVKNHYPDAEITAILVQRNAVLSKTLEGMGIKTYVMPNFDGKKKYSYIFSAWKKFWKTFDLCINGLEPRKIDHLLMWGIAKETMAYTENNWHGKLITYPVMFNRKSMEQISQAQFISNVFDNKPLIPEEWPKINLNDYPISIEAEKVLEQEIPENRYIFISPSNNRQASTISPEDYKLILKPLCEKYQFKVIINCLAYDLSLAEEINKLLYPHSKIVLTPDFSMLLHVMKRCDIFLLGDGGLCHISAALDKPGLILFGQTSAIEWPPLNEKSVYLRHEKDVKLINKDLISKKLEKLIQGSLS